MSISEEKLMEIKKRFLSSARPLVFFDDDPDGLSSFLQFYHLNTEAKGVMVNTHPYLDKVLLRKVDEYQPDLVLVLDISNVQQEFIDGCNAPIIWIDHHEPQKRNNIKYYNPMIDSEGKDNRPISYWSYKITGGPLWIAMVGCIGDWFIPDFADEFVQKYPDILDKIPPNPDDVFFESRLGDLVKVFNFTMKGKNDKAKKCVKILTRISEPYEILDQKTSQGKYLYKHYESKNKEYEVIKKSINVDDSNLLMYIYPGSNTSYTSLLSNEVLHFNPNKFIIIGRKKSGSYKLSLRSKKYEVSDILKQALVGVKGYGGGHRYACGANIDENSFDMFLNSIKDQIN